MLVIRDQSRDGLAQFFRVGVPPEVWKITALLRLHRLNRAVRSIKKDARAAGFFLQGQSAPVMSEAGVLLDEFVFA